MNIDMTEAWVPPGGQAQCVCVCVCMCLCGVSMCEVASHLMSPDCERLEPVCSGAVVIYLSHFTHLLGSCVCVCDQ